MLSHALRRSVAEVHARRGALGTLSDRELTGRAGDLRERPGTADAVREAAALTVEAVRRVTGYTLYDVQIAGGLTLTAGGLAEMATGEGKTLTVALPCAAAALRGRQVHVATPSAYLAERDAEELRPVYELLGLSAVLLPDRDAAAAKPAAYAADVVYGPGYEFGFDYLRDHAAARAFPTPPLGGQTLARLRGRPLTPPPPVQSRRELSLIDEIDSVLLDEATTPLVLASTPEGEPDVRAVRAAAARAGALLERQDFTVRGMQVELAEAIRRERPPGVPLRRPWWQEVRNALQARYVFRRDEHYVIREGDVALVDGNTGRVFEDRTWQAGLHQAVQWKEGLTVTAESVTAARVTRQRFAREYDAMTGLTGTASPAAREFRKLYGLPVVPIPRNRPNRREDRPTRYVASDAEMFRVVAEEAAAERQRGRPVLVGCRTIADSHAASAELAARGVPHCVLNGVQDRDEAELIAAAGEGGRVTVATHMAGRGTDIKPDEAALAAGGLHVLAAGRNRSQRVDRQLAGRAARQGQPGSSRFIVSAEDALLEEHEPSLAAAVAASRRGTSDTLDARMDRLQKRLELEAFRQRTEMLRHEDWVDKVLKAAAG